MTEQEWIKYKESAEYKQFRKDGFSDTEIKEIEETNEYPIVVIDDRKDNPILISKAIMIVLFGEDLNVIGLYINFISLQNFQWKNWKGQQVWEVLGFAKNSYYKYLNRLIDLGLVTPQGDYHKRTLRLNSFWLPESIKIVIGPEHQQKYMRKLKEKILLANPSKYQRENKKFTEEKQQQLQIETMAVEKAQEIVKKKEQKKKAEEKKFP